MRKTLIIAIVVAGIGVLGAAAWYFMHRTADISPDDTTDIITTSTLPIADVSPLPQGSTMQITGMHGNLTVRNFLGDSASYGGTYVVSDNEHYTIVYQRALQKFLIAVNATSRDDIAVQLASSADELAAALDIPPRQLCQLQADISVPDSFAAAFSDARFLDLKFPGCAQ